ncbi:hypothetical protein [Candidatus Avelusimicrobium fimicolum]
MARATAVCFGLVMWLWQPAVFCFRTGLKEARFLLTLTLIASLLC